MRSPALILLAAATASVPTFEPVQPELLGTGASFVNAFADVDGDGDLDLVRRLQRIAEVTPENIRALQADHGVQWADLDGDGDGDLDLALTGSRPDGMHLLLRNGLPPADAKRSIQVKIVDADGRATRAGAEVRVYASGTRRLLGLRLVDTGSGYDAQNDMPVHVGLAATGRVDVEAVWPAGGRRTAARLRGIAPAGQVVEIRVK